MGARSVGIHPVLLDRAGLTQKVDCAVIKSLTELPELVLSGSLPP